MIRTEVIRYGLKAFWLFGPGVATVALSYFLLINLTQGQDVIMLMGERLWAFGCAIVAVVTWAFFIWYSSRLIGYEKKFDDPRWPVPVLSGFPRLLAVNAFVSVQAAIVALPTIHDLSGWWLLALMVAHNIYGILLYRIFARTINGIGYRLASVIVGLAYCAWLLSICFHAETRHTFYLPMVAVLIFVFEVISLRWFVYRRTQIDNPGTPVTTDPDGVDYLRFFGFKTIRVPRRFQMREQNLFKVFNLIAIGAILIYLAVVNSLTLAARIGPLAVILLAFGLIVGASNQLSALSIRKQFNFFVPLVLLAWVVGLFYDPYQLQTTNPSYDEAFEKRPDLNTYFDKWIDHRAEAITQADTFEVYVVLADGGASRSGFWVASVLDAWQQMRPQNKPLQNHLLCLSGASGGGVGNTAFYTQMQLPRGGQGQAANFLKSDFLSYCMAHMLGSDIVGQVLPLHLLDRADAIAATMAHQSQSTLAGAFGKNWEDVADTTGAMPLLFINTTRVQGGTPAVISTVTLKPFSERIDVLNLLNQEQRSLTLGTAAVLGARFPYVSPAAAIGKQQQFVDGGYFDNSGAGIVQEMLYHLDSLMRHETDPNRLALFQKIRFHAVHITNNPMPKDPQAIHPLANDLAAPLLTVFNTYATQTEVNDARLRQFLSEKKGRYTNINLYADNSKQEYPMNWVISEHRLNEMKQEVERISQTKLPKLMN